LANRIFEEDGPEFERLVSSTIRSVTTGIFGVALIQAVLAALGFLVVGLPAAGLWTFVFLLAAILQVGIVVLLPAVLYAFTIAGTTGAIAFAVWCVLVALLDNVLKPVLLGHGSVLGGVPRCHRWLHRHGNDRLICRSHGLSRGLQTFSRLAWWGAHRRTADGCISRKRRGPGNV